MRFKNYKLAVIMAFALLFFSCAPKPNVFTPPTQQESPRAKVEQVEKGVKEVIKQNADLGKKIQEQANTIKEQKLETSEAIIQAEKIKLRAESKELVTEIEAANLINQLKKIESRNLFLENSVSDMQTVVDDQAIKLEEVTDNLNQAQDKIVKRDAEIEILRTQNKDLERVTKENITLANSAAKNGVYKTLFWSAVGVIVALVVFVVVIKVIKPI